ncbi:MAG: cyclic pyranopterin monophosphate synthase MoaC [Actinobacteria bacterium]|nr:MAG: cyclic pyranopterin monophosphate synthase MoaC [Actinomycetota bacterium]
MADPKSKGLTHVDESGRARMVDVGEKAVTTREAVARAKVRMRPETLSLISEGKVPKGDVFCVAKVAGIQAAKKCSELIPMCHPLPLTVVDLSVAAIDAETVEIVATVKTKGQTGVEMEALTAVSVAALTVYDMCKAVDREMVVSDVALIRKSGGASGEFVREE